MNYLDALVAVVVLGLLACLLVLAHEGFRPPERHDTQTTGDALQDDLRAWK